jgi:MerR family transcriptional regulator, copper efflux regulator
VLTIGKVAKRTGLSTSAVRYYERQGLLRSSRLLNDYRVYEEDTINALRFVRQAQTLGFTLTEIKQLLELTRDGQRPCQAVRDLARRHLSDIDARIHQLRSLRIKLRDLLSRRVAARGDELCPLISSATRPKIRKRNQPKSRNLELPEPDEQAHREPA